MRGGGRQKEYELEVEGGRELRHRVHTHKHHPPIPHHHHRRPPALSNHPKQQ
ncbi:hypothetical protein FA95DRAFT_1561800 [Auriscalpium vulgare]|uniref:Uncharacterized protein n=1 Tax=Auriscalpium vulgare TaxID=40419 RepID=A0ACB8RKP9_9AGAM|nr:hypothetical protein FA95DRAFT_1561800 [Auriscalpium vulgare]